MMSKKLETILIWIRDLNREDLKRLLNEAEAELFYRVEEDDEIKGLKRSTFYERLRKGEV